MLNTIFSCTISSSPTIIGITKKSKLNGTFTTASNLYPQKYLTSKNNDLFSFSSNIKCENRQMTDTISSPSIIRMPENSLLNPNTNIASSQFFYSQPDVNLNKSQYYQEKNKTVTTVDKINTGENLVFSSFDSLNLFSKITTTTNSLDVITSTLHNNLNDDLLRSASVKPESNCGGVSSSCYESLSDDSDDYENSNQKNVNIMQPSCSNNKTLSKSNFYFKNDKSNNESQEGKKFYLNFKQLILT